MFEAVGWDKPSCDDWRFLMWDYVSIRHQKVKSALTTKWEMCCQDASEPRWRAGGGRRHSAQKAPVCLFVPKNCDAEKRKILFKRSPSIYWRSRGLQKLMSHKWTKMHRNRVGSQNTVASDQLDLWTGIRPYAAPHVLCCRNNLCLFQQLPRTDEAPRA